MLTKLILLDSAMLILDFITISDLRKFLLDFLRVNRSIKNAKQIYHSQSLKERILLSFIRAHLKKCIKEYTFYHRMYTAVLCTLIPQYTVLIICNTLIGIKSMYVLCFFAALKLVICIIIRMNVDSNRISVYRQK